ncbi:MAG TPA: hypothetical protein VN814_18770 [Caulobacteraceae bacterium]|nr:hypothetical protein [Caulobacteraceae bacterium]
MHTFKVVREEFGWAVRLGPGMTTPFWSQAAALREANALCKSLRSHGVAAEVVVEEGLGNEPGAASRRGTARDSAGAIHGHA